MGHVRIRDSGYEPQTSDPLGRHSQLTKPAEEGKNIRIASAIIVSFSYAVDSSHHRQVPCQGCVDVRRWPVGCWHTRLLYSKETSLFRSSIVPAPVPTAPYSEAKLNAAS